MRLPGQLPLEQAQAQVVAQALVAELARLRVLVQAAVLEPTQVVAQAPVAELARLLVLVLEPQVQALAQAAALTQVREPEPVQVWELAVKPLEPVRAQQLELELAQVRVLEPPLARKPARQQEPAVEPEQVQELRVSRQQELQQHHLPAAAQEPLPYLPVLPKKAPC